LAGWRLLAWKAAAHVFGSMRRRVGPPWRVQPTICRPVLGHGTAYTGAGAAGRLNLANGGREGKRYRKMAKIGHPAKPLMNSGLRTHSGRLCQTLWVGPKGSHGSEPRPNSRLDPEVSGSAGQAARFRRVKCSERRIGSNVAMACVLGFARW
jgi:hypothetical protein